MIRILLMFLISSVLLNATVILGARYSYLDHKATFQETDQREKTALGAGAMIGWDDESYRILLSYDKPSFDKPAKFSQTSLSLQLAEHQDSDIRGFIGLVGSQVKYQHSHSKKEESLNFLGGEIGIILLDERFEKMQMELGYRYMSRMGSNPTDHDFKRFQQFFVGLNIELY